MGILAELVINANKCLWRETGSACGLAGAGSHKPSGGFGTRMVKAMIDRLSGTIEYGSNDAGCA